MRMYGLFWILQKIFFMIFLAYMNYMSHQIDFLFIFGISKIKQLWQQA